MPAFGSRDRRHNIGRAVAGAGREDLKHEYARLCMIYDLIIMCTMAALMYVFAPQLMGFFIADASSKRSCAAAADPDFRRTMFGGQLV